MTTAKEVIGDWLDRSRNPSGGIDWHGVLGLTEAEKQRAESLPPDEKEEVIRFGFVVAKRADLEDSPLVNIVEQAVHVWELEQEGSS